MGILFYFQGIISRGANTEVQSTEIYSTIVTIVGGS